MPRRKSEQPRRDYYAETNVPHQGENETPEIDTGYNTGMIVLETLMQYFNDPIPDQRMGKGGKMISRPPEEMSMSEYAQNFLMNIFYERANDMGFSEYGNYLQSYAQEISETIADVLTGYIEEIRRSMSRLAEILNGGSLTSQQYQEYSDFADSFMDMGELDGM